PKGQSTTCHRNIFEDRSQPELIQGSNVSLDSPNDHAHRTALTENVDTEPAHSRKRHGHVHFESLGEFLSLSFVHDGSREGFELRRRKAVVAHRPNLLVNPKHQQTSYN